MTSGIGDCPHLSSFISNIDEAEMKILENIQPVPYMNLHHSCLKEMSLPRNVGDRAKLINYSLIEVPFGKKYQRLF